MSYGISGLALYVEGTGKWIYDLCASDATRIKFGVIFFVIFLCLSAFFRSRRFFGSPVWIICAVGCACLGQIYLMENHWLTGSLLYLAAAILMFVHCAVVKGEYGLSEIEIGRKTTIVLMVLVVLFAGFFRFYRLGDVPDGIINDEARGMRYAINIMRGEGIKAYDGYEHAALCYVASYSQAFFFKLLGVSIFTGRAAVAVTGVLGVIAFFFMTDVLFSRPVALLAASFLAGCYCSSGFDRLGGVGINQGVVFTCTAIYLFLLAEKKRSMLCGLLSGVALGVVLGTFHTFKTVPAIFLVFIIYRVISEKGFLRKNWLILVLVLVSFYAVAGYHLQRQWRHSINYMQGISVFAAKPLQASASSNTSTLLGNVGLFVRMLFLHMSESIFLRSNLATLNAFLVPLFFLGFISALYCLKKYNYFLVLVWFVLGPMLGILSWPGVRRIIPVLPAVYILAALGAYMFLKAIISSLRLKGHMFFIISLVLLSAAILTVNVYIYFNKCEICTIFENKEVGEYVDGLIGEKYVYIFDLADPGSTDVFTYEKRRGGDSKKYFSNINKRNEVYSAIFNTPPRDRDVVFVFVTEEGKRLAEDMKRAMPYAIVEQKQCLISCAIPRNKLARERGAVVSYQTALPKTAPSQWRIARAVSTEFDWRDDSMPYPFRIEMEGYFYVPRDDTYSFRSIGGGDTEVSIDGKPVSLAPSRCALSSGAHRVRLRHLQTESGKFSLALGREGEKGAPIYVWGRVLRNFCGFTKAPRQLSK